MAINKACPIVGSMPRNRRKKFLYPVPMMEG